MAAGRCKHSFTCFLSDVEDLPAIGLFRNGQLKVYEGDESNEKGLLAWLTAEDTLKIIGIIDEVS